MPAGSAAAGAAWCSEPARADRPPVVPGPNVHLVYAIPYDAADQLATIGPRLEEAARSVEEWWLREDAQRAPRFDRHDSSCGLQLDVTTLRLDGTSRSYERYADIGVLIAGEAASGLPSEHAITMVFYDGPGGIPDVCGQGGGALDEPGIGIVYLNACPEIPDDLLLAHELLHALGALPEGAPHGCPDDPGHPCDDPVDALWPTTTGTPLAGLRLDAARDDYYAHEGAWSDLRDSIYLRRVGEQATKLALAVRGGGTVSSPIPGVDCSTPCTIDWDVRMDVPLRARPAAGRRFIRWEGACTGRAACVVSLRGARIDVSAVFAEPTLRLELGVSGRGRVQAGARWSCSRACTRQVRSFTPLRLRAQPAAGWRLKRWSGPCRRADLTCVVPMEQATQVRVVFARASQTQG